VRGGGPVRIHIPMTTKFSIRRDTDP
jgi:hypothetical protein